MASLYASVIGTVAVIIGLAVLVLAMIRRLGGPGLGTSGPGLRVLRRMSVGPRQGIALVEVGDRVLAVSVGDGGVRTLAEFLPEEATADAFRAPPQPVAGPWLASLKRYTGIGAAVAVLLVAPPLAHAQQAPPAPAAQAPASRPAGQAPRAARPAPSGTGGLTRVDDALTRAIPRMDVSLGGGGDGLKLTGTVGIVVLMGLLSLLPMLVLMMTGFTRILIVLQLLRQAIGAQSVPPPQLITALALVLTGFVMTPTLTAVNRDAITPWLDGRMTQGEMLTVGARPFREFMLRETRPADVRTFLSLAGATAATDADIPLPVLVSAFVTSELRIAFQMGFALFLPFIVIDVVVSSVLMSMGMMMLPPTMVSLPFKLLLFVLVDGWSLVVQGLVRSFH